MTEVLKNINDIRKKIKEEKKKGKKVGFVPTMGYLHEGHLSLVKKSIKDSDLTVVSIFVNPTQFGPNEDLNSYPRDFKRDKELLEKEGVDIIFYPDAEEIYGDNFLTFIDMKKLPEKLCGKRRPGHFRGVLTVVLKLFNIVMPDTAYFGQKDAQQAIIIKKMVEDLNLHVKIKVLPIVREDDGLAMSSRNKYLNEEERKKALSLFNSLKRAEELFKKGIKDSKTIKDEMYRIMYANDGVVVDYIEIVDLKTLNPLNIIKDKALCAVSAYVGKARLIDNTILGGSFEDLNT